ncbi:hypothetical protein [Crocinitomix catalasitica]|uniref:hypothetical protein n=1 Tax=Crocinitomix catalasitica TaxID=184607 RepID=UPI0004833368|nr:hypothetical protein [Crocinitomix catalasitica]
MQFKHKKEAYKLSVNCLAGWKFVTNKNQLSNIGLFFNFYYGINPNGQFSNIPIYPWAGIKLIYDFK